METCDLAAELASTLDWWTQAGVDCVVQDDARAWLAEQILPGMGRGTGKAGGKGSTQGAAAGESYSPLAVDERSPSPPRGGSKESFPDQLDLFQEWLRTSAALPYAAPSAPRICPAGDPAAGLMILAAMPSNEDCAAGMLLSGAPGRLFDRMLAAIGRNRETIYLAGLSCLRPAAGRFDKSGLERCAAIARHHIGLIKPKALLLFGDACARALLGSGAIQARGKVHQLETQTGAVEAVATLSPEYLLQQPSAKAMAWADLQLVMERL